MMHTMRAYFKHIKHIFQIFPVQIHIHSALINIFGCNKKRRWNFLLFEKRIHAFTNASEPIVKIKICALASISIARVAEIMELVPTRPQVTDMLFKVIRTDVNAAKTGVGLSNRMVRYKKPFRLRKYSK